MFPTLLFKELREQSRTFRLWILGGVLLVSGMLSPLLAKYTPLILNSIPGIPPEMVAFIPEPTIFDSFVQYLKNSSQFGLLIIIILTMGVVAQEIERGTAAMLMTQPIKRSGVILAKWAAGLITLILGITVGALGYAFYTLVLFEPFSWTRFLFLNSLLLAFLVFYMTLALMASSLVKSQAHAAMIAFAGLLIILILDSLPVIGDYFPGELLTWGGSLFSPVVQSAWPALMTCLVMTLVFLVTAILAFQHKEI